MKKRLFGATAGKIFLALGCLILAILFWLAVKFIEIGGMPLISSIVG